MCGHAVSCDVCGDSQIDAWAIDFRDGKNLGLHLLLALALMTYVCAPIHPHSSSPIHPSSIHMSKALCRLLGGVHDTHTHTHIMIYIHRYVSSIAGCARLCAGRFYTWRHDNTVIKVLPPTPSRHVGQLGH